MEIFTDFLWVEKYRPKTVSDCILPVTLKAQFQQFIDQKNVPNLLLTGGPGTGKTTVARAMLEELDCEYAIINGSLNGNIDTLRNDIKIFASTISLYSEGRKYVILDEADFLNPNTTQPALRNFMEEYSKFCGFILTCNYSAKILKELKSRCSVIEFKIPSNEKAKLATQFVKRTRAILTEEGIPFEPDAVNGVIAKYFPDWRRCLNELQAYSATGRIDAGILSNFTDQSISSLVELMKAKNFTGCRKWVSDHLDIEPIELFDALYTKASDVMEKTSVPELVLILAKYSYQSAFVVHQEINTVACILEIMRDCQFK